jgi:hypothetical protein
MENKRHLIIISRCESPYPGREVMEVLQIGVFKNPQIVPELEQEEDTKTGRIFEDPESNNTFS